MAASKAVQTDKCWVDAMVASMDRHWVEQTVASMVVTLVVAMVVSKAECLAVRWDKL
jgi:hypothetical protein